MAVQSQPQIAIDERVIESDELEAALEAREVAKAARREAHSSYASANTKARELIDALELDDSPARIGRFRLVVRPVEARSVSFETSPTSRVTITVDREEAF